MCLVVSPLLFAPLILAGCGGSTGSSDASTSGDASGSGDASHADGAVDANACTVSSADFGDVGSPSVATAFFYGGDQSTPALRIFRARLEANNPGDPFDLLDLRFIQGRGAFLHQAIKVGTYEITGDDLNAGTCGVCATIGTNYVGSPDHLNGTTGEVYVATSGTVTITSAGAAVGDKLTGTLSNVKFHHATIDEDTGESQLVDDDCTTSLTAAFDDTLVAPQF